MEYIKHLIMLKWDLFMADIYSFLFVVGAAVVLIILATIIAVISNIRKSLQERIKARAADRQDRAELKKKQKKIADEEALLRTEMKT